MCDIFNFITFIYFVWMCAYTCGHMHVIVYTRHSDDNLQGQFSKPIMWVPGTHSCRAWQQVPLPERSCQSHSIYEQG